MPCSREMGFVAEGVTELRLSLSLTEIIVALYGIAEVLKERTARYCLRLPSSPRVNVGLVLLGVPPPTLVFSPLSSTQPSCEPMDFKVFVTGASKAPMSQCGPCGRWTPRWSVRAHVELLPASMAGLPAPRDMGLVKPPLFVRAPSSGLEVSNLPVQVAPDGQPPAIRLSAIEELDRELNISEPLFQKILS